MDDDELSLVGWVLPVLGPSDRPATLADEKLSCRFILPQLKTFVLGERLASCCFDPLTGYYRDGFCHTGAMIWDKGYSVKSLTADFFELSAGWYPDYASATICFAG
jgi:hypothetical protein